MTEPTLYLLDTNIISHMMRNPTGMAAQHALEKARQNPANAMLTCVIVECELLFGLRRRASPRWQQQYQWAMGSIEVLALEPQVANTYAELRTRLEELGTPIGPHDTLIAAQALSLGAILVSADAEFTRVPGLRVENWLHPLANN
jgi:tRNA(fMet)-specific endonuclease VapC